MANQEHSEILGKGVRTWNQWRDDFPNVQPDLRALDLNEQDLSYIDFTETDLSEARLHYCFFRYASFANAICRKTSFVSSILHAANFRNADLSGADFTNVHLADWAGQSRANVAGAIFFRTRFTTESNSKADGSFLDLGMCEGLERAKFDNENFLNAYFIQAFHYAHRDLTEKVVYPDLVEEAISKLRVLVQLYRTEEPPSELIAVVTTLTIELVDYLKNHPRELLKLAPRQFEELIAELLSSFGWEIHLTPPSKDGGYDIFAISKDIAGVRSSWVIECKKYAPERKVGIDIARSLYSVKGELRASNAMLATTSHFTRGVREFKASRYDFEMKDFEAIVEWINNYRPNPNGRLYVGENKLILRSHLDS